MPNYLFEILPLFFLDSLMRDDIPTACRGIGTTYLRLRVGLHKNSFDLTLTSIASFGATQVQGHRYRGMFNFT